jgi:hypothetical protein
MSGAGWPWADIRTTIARRSLTGSFAVRATFYNRRPSAIDALANTSGRLPTRHHRLPHLKGKACPIHTRNRRITRSTIKDEALVLQGEIYRNCAVRGLSRGVEAGAEDANAGLVVSERPLDLAGGVLQARGQIGG